MCFDCNANDLLNGIEDNKRYEFTLASPQFANIINDTRHP